MRRICQLGIYFQELRSISMILKINVSTPPLSQPRSGEGARSQEGGLFTFTAAPPLAIPLNLPWPPLTKPLHPQSAREHLVARCAPHTQRSRAHIHKPRALALTAFLLLTNASLDRCSLTQCQGMELIGHFLKWHKINEVSSSPTQEDDSWASCSNVPFLP